MVLSTGAVLAALLALPQLAQATLGRDDSTVDADSSGLHAQRAAQRSATTAGGAGYAVHPLQLAGGTVVKEFAGAGGTVFAVTWSGPTIPDLSVLLGDHFARYRMAAQRSSAAARAPVIVHDADLVVRNEGHPRAFHGVAYLPGLLPAGFDLSMLK